MEPRFGVDFGNVRVHTDGRAATAAAAVGADAYTVGTDIVFNAGRFAPGSQAGRHLLAHELTHVAQQASDQGSTGGALEVGAADSPLEQEAERMADSLVTGRRVETPSGDPTIARSRLYRACGAAAIGPADVDCNLTSAVPNGTRFLFDKGCDEWAPGQEAAFGLAVDAVDPKSTINLFGIASTDGDRAFNLSLSCARLATARAVVAARGRSGQLRTTEAAGPQGIAGDVTFRAVAMEERRPQTPTPTPTPIKPGAQTPCERDCEFDLQRCLNFSDNPLACIAQRSGCLGACAGAAPAFEVCARLLQPPVEISGCNHAYIETPTKRYAIITPCTGRFSFIVGGVAVKTDRSPDPCNRRPTCIECVPKPGVTDLEQCFATAFAAYAAPSVHAILGPNSNTFAGTLARGCCANMAVQPPAFGCVPGWADPPAPAAVAPCPACAVTSTPPPCTGPPVC